MPGGFAGGFAGAVARAELVEGLPAGGPAWPWATFVANIVGALLLGAIAWPKPGDPAWYLPALIAGVATTIAGFAVRYMAHLKQRKEIQQAKREAEKR